MKNIFLVLCLLFLTGIACAESVRVYPNPWVPSDKSGRRGSLADGITFDNLPNSGGEILIYNVAGQLVKKQVWNAPNTAVTWYGKNDSSQNVASGVYIWVIDAGGKHTGKIVVVR